MKKEPPKLNPNRRIPKEIADVIENEAARIKTEPSRLLSWLLRRAVEEKLPLKPDAFIP